MAELHDALTTLAPIEWADVPLDNLPEYLQSCFNAGELICNSVPPPPNGEPFHSAKPHHKRPNAARCAKDMHVSSARPSQPHEAHEALQKQWGKPYKFSAASNPHGVALYKMAGHDRHGAWFARRSVHEGIGFAKFRRSMLREFSHTLTVQGGPGAGAIRGLAADSRLEDVQIDGVGQMEVYLLSGQMPKPVTPRDFVQLLMSSPDTLSEKSASNVEGESKHVPRSYMIVSKPVQYPDAPDRSGFVRGKYESVEMTREIPLHSRKTAQSKPNFLDSHKEEPHPGRHRGPTIGFAESRGEEAKDEQRDVQHDSADGEDNAENDAELNPVEWIMVTRSDPGGGIPRFLVDRGTPDAMLGDITKFLDWAAAQEDVPDPAEDVVKQNEVSETNTQVALAADATAESPAEQATSAPPSSTQAQQPDSHVSNVTHVREAGLTAYAPTAVVNHLHDYLHPTHAPISGQVSSDSSSDSSSVTSFMSAAEIRRMSTAPDARPEEGEDASLRSATSSTDLGDRDEKKNLNSHEKEVQKLMQQREKLDRKLAKKREEEEQKLKKAQEKDRSEEDKQRERHEKEIQKAEERHRREIEKLEQKKAKEAKKAEEKRRKKDEQTKLSLVSRERDESRSQLDIFKRENRLLLERMEELHRENTALAARLGKFAPEVLREVQDEVGRKRSGSVKNESKRSMESVESKGS